MEEAPTLVDAYRLGGKEAVAIFNGYDALIGRILCEDGNDGLQMVGQWREDLRRGHDPVDIAKAALIMLECYSQILIERGLSMSRHGHVATA